ncbi:hypothetical protein Hanom_Chr09g00817721 [Helianthus anomalus]
MSVPWLLLCYTATIPVGFFLYFVLGGAIGKHFVSHFVFAIRSLTFQLFLNKFFLIHICLLLGF